MMTMIEMETAKREGAHGTESHKSLVEPEIELAHLMYRSSGCCPLAKPRFGDNIGVVQEDQLSLLPTKRHVKEPQSNQYVDLDRDRERRNRYDEFHKPRKAE